jgi:hypothetical protein
VHSLSKNIQGREFVRVVGLFKGTVSVYTSAKHQPQQTETEDGQRQIGKSTSKKRKRLRVQHKQKRNEAPETPAVSVSQTSESSTVAPTTENPQQLSVLFCSAPSQHYYEDDHHRSRPCSQADTVSLYQSPPPSLSPASIASTSNKYSAVSFETSLSSMDWNEEIIEEGIVEPNVNFRKMSSLEQDKDCPDLDELDEWFANWYVPSAIRISRRNGLQCVESTSKFKHRPSLALDEGGISVVFGTKNDSIATSSKLSGTAISSNPKKNGHHIPPNLTRSNSMDSISSAITITISDCDDQKMPSSVAAPSDSYELSRAHSNNLSLLNPVRTQQVISTQRANQIQQELESEIRSFVQEKLESMRRDIQGQFDMICGLFRDLVCEGSMIRSENVGTAGLFQADFSGLSSGMVEEEVGVGDDFDVPVSVNLGGRVGEEVKEAAVDVPEYAAIGVQTHLLSKLPQQALEMASETVPHINLPNKETSGTLTAVTKVSGLEPLALLPTPSVTYAHHFSDSEYGDSDSQSAPCKRRKSIEKDFMMFI